MCEPTDKVELRCQQSRIEADGLTKTAVFDALQATGITAVTAEFDGHGDSGQIDEVSAKAGDVDIELPAGSLEIYVVDWHLGLVKRQQSTLHDAIEELCYGYLGQEHGGWGDGEGAYGEFVFDVAKRSIHLDFNERFTDATCYVHEF